MKRVLITGATGLIGTRLTEMLVGQGYEVSHLGRMKNSGAVKSFTWDIDKGIIEEGAFTNIDTVIHLAGANVSDKRWTNPQKNKILESRTKSAALLARYLERNQHVQSVISASGIGYYGFGSANEEFTEEHKPGTDFLATVVEAWEKEVNAIPIKRIVKLRIGIVLSEKGGALKELTTPIRWWVGAPLGKGDQYISWIHIDDLCRLFVKAIEDNTLHGVYNAVAHHTTNAAMTRAIAKTLNKPLWLPSIPAFVLKLLLGEMADIIVNGSIVSSKKIQETGFKFQFPVLEGALNNLLKT